MSGFIYIRLMLISSVNYESYYHTIYILVLYVPSGNKRFLCPMLLCVCVFFFVIRSNPTLPCAMFDPQRDDTHYNCLGGIDGSEQIDSVL